MKKKILIVIAAALMIASMAGCSASWQRSMKSFESNMNGGLNRTVTVYDYNGDPIKSWSGKFDMSESETEVFFDIDGKRIIIHNGIVISEEQ